MFYVFLFIYHLIESFNIFRYFGINVKPVGNTFSFAFFIYQWWHFSRHTITTFGTVTSWTSRWGKRFSPSPFFYTPQATYREGSWMVSAVTAEPLIWSTCYVTMFILTLRELISQWDGIKMRHVMTKSKDFSSDPMSLEFIHWPAQHGSQVIHLSVAHSSNIPVNSIC